VIALIATDIDGTLLNSSDEIPPANIAALRRAHARGVLVVMATARKRDSTERIGDQLGIPYAMICQAGATSYDAEGQQISEFAIPLDLARAIAQLADEHGHGLVTTIAEQNFYPPGSRADLQEGFGGQAVDSNQAALTSAPTRLLARGEEAARLIMERFRSAPLTFNRHYRDGLISDVVITSTAATKHHALTALCGRWGRALHEVIALGDAEADIGMIRAAGVGVAMGNAEPEVRAAANWVAPTNDEGGVAAALQRFLVAP
jgi:5-amino-6-(5-phospho-D-ribitylamino)uracil phosphatase